MGERRRKVWINTAEAILLLGGGAGALDELISEGVVRSTKIGGVTYVYERDLFPYIKPTAATNEPSVATNEPSV